jgi:pimeloyl-ACP methyl ester carboxylesterase
MAFYAKVVAALSKQLDVNRVHLVGHSMGGAVAVLAAELIANVGAVVSVEGNLVADDCGMVSRGIAAQSLSAFSHDGYDVFLAKLEASPDPDEQAWATWAADADPATLHEAALSLVAWCDTGKLSERWRGIERAVYVYGERSGYPDRLTDLLRPAATFTIPGEGHFPMLGAPDALTAIIAEACFRARPLTTLKVNRSGRVHGHGSRRRASLQPANSDRCDSRNALKMPMSVRCCHSGRSAHAATYDGFGSARR